MSYLFTARAKAPEGSAGETARSSEPNRAVEAAALATESVTSIALADIRHAARLSQIPNDAIVTFSFGKPHQIQAFGMTYEGCKTASRGKVPGTDIPLPPVHFLTRQEFGRLVMRAEAVLDPARDDERDESIQIQAWMDTRNGLIELGVPGVKGSQLPPSLDMRAAVAKGILGIIVHEAAHAAGKGEFGAFRAEYDFLHKIGAISAPKTHLEIMLEISDLYQDSPSAIAEAQREFEAACKADNCRDQDRAYWEYEQKKLDQLGERDEFGLDFALDFPDDWDVEAA